MWVIGDSYACSRLFAPRLTSRRKCYHQISSLSLPSAACSSLWLTRRHGASCRRGVLGDGRPLGTAKEEAAASAADGGASDSSFSRPSPFASFRWDEGLGLQFQNSQVGYIRNIAAERRCEGACRQLCQYLCCSRLPVLPTASIKSGWAAMRLAALHTCCLQTISSPAVRCATSSLQRHPLVRR